MGFDAAGQVLTRTNELGHVTTFAYDAAGRMTSQTDAEGIVTRYEYDALGRLSAVIENYLVPYAATNEINVRTEYSYDEQGNLLWVKDANGHIARTYGYDARNLRIRAQDALSNTQILTYTARGELAATTDARNLRIRAQDALSNTQVLTYTARGELAATTDALTQTTVYTYSALAGQVTAIQRPDESLAFRYDALGRREAMTDSVGSTSFTYDDLGRLEAVTDPFSVTVSYGYDAAGNRTELVYPGSRTVSYQYDPLHRLQQVTDWDTQSTSYQYDVLGRLEEVARPNGVESTFGYDNAHRLEDLWHVDTNVPTTLAHYAYSYDDVGNRNGAVEVTGGVTTSIAYQYDPLYRLTDAEYSGGSRNGLFYEYSYDAVGNRVAMTDTLGSTAYTYDDANRILTAGGQSYSYDANGNLTSDGVSSYAYDSANRLASATQGGTTSSYRYNALGNRLQQATSGVTTTYLLDLNQPLVQVLSDGSSDYLYGMERIGEEAGSDWAYHLGDALGSVRLTTNITGTLIGHAHYAPFGEVLAGSTVETPFGFAGEQTDGTGLQYLRARYYAPGSGQFMTRDPFEGWQEQPYSLHPYQYAHSNPIRYIDPNGKCRNIIAPDCPPWMSDREYAIEVNNRGAQPSTPGYVSQQIRDHSIGQSEEVPQRHPGNPFKPQINFELVEGAAEWTDAEMDTIFQAAYDIGEAVIRTLRPYYGDLFTNGEIDRIPYVTPAQAFVAVFGEMTFIKQAIACPATDANGNLLHCWAFVRTPNEIWLYNEAIVPDGGTQFISHELAHCFDNGIGRSPRNTLGTVQTDNPNFPNREFGDSRRLFTGFAGLFEDNGPGWQQSLEGTIGEEFADMFLGWVYDRWQVNDRGALTINGQARHDFMENRMLSWIQAAIGGQGDKFGLIPSP